MPPLPIFRYISSFSEALHRGGNAWRHSSCIASYSVAQWSPRRISQPNAAPFNRILCSVRVMMVAKHFTSSKNERVYILMHSHCYIACKLYTSVQPLETCCCDIIESTMVTKAWSDVTILDWAEAEPLTNAALEEKYPGKVTKAFLKTFDNTTTVIHYDVQKLNNEELDSLLSLVDCHSQTGRLEFRLSSWNAKTKAWDTFTQPWFTTAPGRDGSTTVAQGWTPGEPSTYVVNEADIPARYLTQLTGKHATHSFHEDEGQYEVTAALRVDEAPDEMKMVANTAILMLNAEVEDQGRQPSWPSDWELA